MFNRFNWKLVDKTVRLNVGYLLIGAALVLIYVGAALS